MFRTSNPAFRGNAWQEPAQSWGDLASQGRLGSVPAARAAGTMTVQGTVNKSFLLLAMCVVTSVTSWAGLQEGWMSPLVVIGGAVGALITSLVCCFAPRTAHITAPLYALLKGFFVGGISYFYAERFADPGKGLNTGLVLNAALLTFGVMGGLLIGYTTRLIRPGPVFRNITIAGTLGLLLYAVVAMGASLFGSYSLASVYDPTNGGMISIGFSLLAIGLASANFVLDFEFIENGARAGLPRRMEWYGGFGLLVTLVWLYLELLRLLAKLSSRD